MFRGRVSCCLTFDFQLERVTAIQAMNLPEEHVRPVCITSGSSARIITVVPGTILSRYLTDMQ